MENSRLAPELERVERLLACGPRAAPSPALRRRVLDSAQAELRQRMLNQLRTALRREEKRSVRRFVAACAATLLIGAGFVFGVAHGGRFTADASSPTVYDIARQLQQFSPEVSRKDLLVQAALRHIGSDASCDEILNNFFADKKSHDHK
jgi:hypothetical protein